MSNSTLCGPVSPQALASHRKLRPDIIRTVVARSLERQSEVVQHGEQAERLLTAGLEFTAQTLETVAELGDPSLLEFQLQWSNDRLPHDGVHPEHLLARFEIYRDVIAQLLPPEHAAEINQFVDWLIARQRALANLDEQS